MYGANGPGLIENLRLDIGPQTESVWLPTNNLSPMEERKEPNLSGLIQHCLA
jgi:hypothetical protein